MLLNMCWSLSPVFVKKRARHGLSKKIWTHEGPSIEKKKEKKSGHMKVHEKEKKEIAMLSKEFI